MKTTTLIAALALIALGSTSLSAADYKPTFAVPDEDAETYEVKDSDVEEIVVETPKKKSIVDQILGSGLSVGGGPKVNRDGSVDYAIIVKKRWSLPFGPVTTTRTKVRVSKRRRKRRMICPLFGF